MSKKRMIILGMCIFVCVFSGKIEVKAASSVPFDLQVGVGAVLENLDGIEEMEGVHPCVFAYNKIGVAKVDRYLNIRAGAGTEFKVVGKMANEAVCEILSVEDEWGYIQSGEVEGYVSIDYLLQGKNAILEADSYVNTVVKVTADALKVREKPNLECEIITTLAKGEELEIVDMSTEGWIKVLLDGEEVYVSSDYVEVTDTLKTAITLSELLYGEGVSDVRVDICEYAKQFLGNPYVYGGTSLTKGTDCSGFILRIFEHYGVKLPRSSSEQANKGTKISSSQLKPGDLVFYAKGGSINHVTMYIGAGKVIHASSPSTGIRISDYGYRNPYCFRSILQ